MDRQAAKSGIKRNERTGILEGVNYVFNGMNNILDPVNLNIEDGFVVDAKNVDFDNTNSAVRRLGYVVVSETAPYQNAYHSAWNNENKTIAYLVYNSFIYEYDGAHVPIPIIQLTTNDHTEFCQVNDVVVYSNGTDFGVIGGVNTQTRTYSPEFKVATRGGINLEFYNGRLYFSRENNLYCTDTFDIEHVDVRFNRVATFQHSITMCKRVEDGLWVGTEKYVYFLKGDDIREGGYEQIIAAKYGVVYGTACKTNAEYLPSAKSENNVVVFLSTGGICSGSNGGSFKNHSFNVMSFDAGKRGAATIRTQHGVSQYVATMDMDDGYEYNPYGYDIPVDINTI